MCYISTIRVSSCFYRLLQKGLLFSHLGNSWPQINLIFTRNKTRWRDGKKNGGTLEMKLKKKNLLMTLNHWDLIKPSSTVSRLGNHFNFMNVQQQHLPKTVIRITAQADSLMTSRLPPGRQFQYNINTQFTTYICAGLYFPT